MSALAHALRIGGAMVTGSDRYIDQGIRVDALERLTRAGVRLYPQDGSGLTSDVRAVVISTAIEPQNPEWVRAEEMGIPVRHRSELLAELVKARQALAVAGTSGKTTVTAMIGHIMAACGWDPLVINGGAVVEWVREDNVGNVRAGAGDRCVFEADESDGSLMRYQPHTAVITNISKDHFELDEAVDLFRRFSTQVSGDLLVRPDVAELLGCKALLPSPDVSFSPGDGWRIPWGGKAIRCPVPGRHNAENLHLAMHACRAAGCPEQGIADGAASFAGVKRRLEVVGRAGGITVIDDYAHNPAKIAASWKAVRETSGRVLGIWRPHGYGPLALMQDDLAGAWADCMGEGDRLYILPVYYAGGTTSRTLESDAFVDRLCKDGLSAVYVDSYRNLKPLLVEDIHSGDAILGMGARDPELPDFLRAMSGYIRRIVGDS